MVHKNKSGFMVHKNKSGFMVHKNKSGFMVYKNKSLAWCHFKFQPCTSFHRFPDLCISLTCCLVLLSLTIYLGFPSTSLTIYLWSPSLSNYLFRISFYLSNYLLMISFSLYLSRYLYFISFSLYLSHSTINMITFSLSNYLSICIWSHPSWVLDPRIPAVPGINVKPIGLLYIP